MKAMVLEAVTRIEENPTPLRMVDMPRPVPGKEELLVRVDVCAVCHTELDEIEGRAPPPRLPVVLGHQVVGTVAGIGQEVDHFTGGQRVGVAWIYSACGHCRFCLSDRENLCPEFRATGRDVHGGYAEYMTAPAAFAYPIPDSFSSAKAAPLLCAGAIGYRSLKLTGISDGQKLGLTGFGASGHLVLSLVRHLYPLSSVYVFARNPKEREFALELGAIWAGDAADLSPEKCDAIIDTTPAWKPVVEALKNLEPGGRLIINAIRKEEMDKEYLLRLDYPAHLWLEKEIKSVANVVRKDVAEFLNLAAEMDLKPEIQSYALHEANQALSDLKNRSIRGAKVLRVSQ
jgi:propanol-preferring alcohol dehydrogenase